MKVEENGKKQRTGSRQIQKKQYKMRSQTMGLKQRNLTFMAV